jgi:hypothetical protein
MRLPIDTIQPQNTLKSIRVRLKRARSVDRRMPVGGAESEGRKNEYFKRKKNDFLLATDFKLLSQINGK